MSIKPESHDQIILALEELKYGPGSNEETKSGANSLLVNIREYEFVVMLSFWHFVLKKIDRVNELLQEKDNALKVAVKHIRGLVSDLEAKRETIFLDSESEAKEIAERCGGCVVTCYRVYEERKVQTVD